jgi:hypothetical protein
VYSERKLRKYNNKGRIKEVEQSLYPRQLLRNKGNQE